MKPHTKLASAAIAALLVASPLAMTLSTAAHADSAGVTKQAAVGVPLGQAAKDTAIIRTAKEASTALREVRAARIALLNGETDLAARYATDAQNNLAMSDIYMKDFVLASQKVANGDEYYVPFDTQISLSEDFVPTPEKAQGLMKANEHMANGNRAKAVETLKLAQVDVTVGAAMLPAKASLSHVKDAVALMQDKKFYEANLALKAVEDAIVVESYGIDAIPVQGGTG